MGARIETKKGFVDHYIDCSIDRAISFGNNAKEFI